MLLINLKNGVNKNIPEILQKKIDFVVVNGKCGWVGIKKICEEFYELGVDAIYREPCWIKR